MHDLPTTTPQCLRNVAFAAKSKGKIAPELVGNAINSIGATGKRFIGVCCVSSGGFKGVETLEFNYNGTIAGVKVEADPDSNNK